MKPSIKHVITFEVKNLQILHWGYYFYDLTLKMSSSFLWEHQKIRIDGFKSPIRIFPDDLDIVPGFYEMLEVENSLDLHVFRFSGVLPEALLSGPLETFLFSKPLFLDETPKS